jgi:hypothetical protein
VVAALAVLVMVAVTGYALVRALADGGDPGATAASTTTATTTPGYAAAVVGFFRDAEGEIRGLQSVSGPGSSPAQLAAACSTALTSLESGHGATGPAAALPTGLAAARATMPSEELRLSLDAAVGSVLGFLRECAAGRADCRVPPATEVEPSIRRLNDGLAAYTSLRAPLVGVACEE